MIYWIYLLFLESTVALVDIEVLGSSVSILINNDLQGMKLSYAAILTRIV